MAERRNGTILGWGLGFAFHANGVSGIPGLGKDWEERMIEKEMHRIDQQEYQKRGISSRKLPSGKVDAEDELELKEVCKVWKDSDLV
jgi:hypothetical protein